MKVVSNVAKLDTEQFEGAMHFLEKGDVDVSLEVSGEESDLAGADHWVVVQERTCVPG